MRRERVVRGVRGERGIPGVRTFICFVRHPVSKIVTNYEESKTLKIRGRTGHRLGNICEALNILM